LRAKSTAGEAMVDPFSCGNAILKTDEVAETLQYIRTSCAH